MFAWFIKNVAKLLPSMTITVNGKPYLTRYYLFLRDWRWLNIYIHHFHSSDQEQELHNHPWKWAYSFVFEGGYIEEYRIDETHKVWSRQVSAPAINVVKHSSFHRVDLLDEENGTWTLFLAGPRIIRPPEWGFWNRKTCEFTYFRENPEAIP